MRENFWLLKPVVFHQSGPRRLTGLQANGVHPLPKGDGDRLQEATVSSLGAEGGVAGPLLGSGWDFHLIPLQLHLLLLCQVLVLWLLHAFSRQVGPLYMQFQPAIFPFPLLFQAAHYRVDFSLTFWRFLLQITPTFVSHTHGFIFLSDGVQLYTYCCDYFV